MDYGVFVKLEEGIEGLIHNSPELSGKTKTSSQAKFFTISKCVKIININKDARRISLVTKRLWIIHWKNLKNQLGKK